MNTPSTILMSSFGWEPRSAVGPAPSNAVLPPVSRGDGDEWNQVATVKKSVAGPTTAAPTVKKVAPRYVDLLPLGSCTLGLQCPYGAMCTNGPHAPEVERVFACFRSQDEQRQYKFQLCTRRDAHAVVECVFYHEGDPEETTKMFCANCLQVGHLSSVCTWGLPAVKK